MHILRFFQRLIDDAQDMNGYAIIIIVLLILLVISYLRRKFADSNSENLESEKLAFEQKFKEIEAERYKLQMQVNENQKQIELYQNSENQLRKEICDLKEKNTNYQDKYSKAYQELLLAKEKFKASENQLHAYRLSPHFLKNLINSAFIESKLRIEDYSIKNCFSLFGFKLYTLNNLKLNLNTYNDKLEKSLTLLIDILNYLIYSHSISNIHLQTEISHLEKFCSLIEMNKNIKVDIITKLNRTDIQVPPTVLFNYIDNAIKHGYFKKKALKINLTSRQNIFEYSVETPMHPEMNQKKLLGGLGDQEYSKFLDQSSNTYNISNTIHNNTYIAKLQLTV
ncbi:hypothetical protein EO244_00525 [Ancylomarina salipaludis]|uniref:Signal transduction histidine kinase internal region domain-containing protein n=1 Tax=Ancylomarina salipaludis TaxID=2501299 RepID=A0A4Q1JQ06_9BACT|nr:hypothetical protein [Ancylomarina salipaludis]RXQ97406.1 hypothetical protein EO244_00525 [Ancylomarina salipaludis]